MLEKLAENHILWIKMVVNMGCDKTVAEDIVQSMYLRMHRLINDEKKIMYNDDEVNRFFVYVTLKNMFIDYQKAKSKYIIFEYLENDVEEDSEHTVQEEFNYEEQEAFQDLIDSMHSEIMSWERYDIILSSLYFKTDFSLRDISKGSGISLMSIYNSIKNYKCKLSEKFVEDFEDYSNGDYHLIKTK